MDPTTIRFDRPPAVSGTQAQLTSIRASLVEWAEQLGGFPGKAAAFILDLDAYAVGTGANPQRHGSTRPSELERVLQQVSDHRTQDLPVSLDRDSILNGHHGERDVARACVQACGGSDVVNESGHPEGLGILKALYEPDLGERATDKIACPQEVPLEHRAGAPADSDIPGLEHIERQDRGVQQVAQFMREEPQALVPACVRSVKG